MVKAPSCDPSDFGVAYYAKATLFIPEITKRSDTPKHLPHMILFAFLEVGFIGGIVRVGFAFHFNVSFDGSAVGVVQPDFNWPSLVIAGFTEEAPVSIPTPFKIFLFEPA